MIRNISKKFLETREIYQVTKLGLYIVSKGLSAPEFARYAKLNPMTIYRILNGHPVRKDIAKRLVRVTKKQLTLEDFGYETKA